MFVGSYGNVKTGAARQNPIGVAAGLPATATIRRRIRDPPRAPAWREFDAGCANVALLDLSSCALGANGPHLNTRDHPSQHATCAGRPGARRSILKAYEHLFAMNQGYEQVARSLRALAKYPALKPEEIRRFEELARESCAATNTHLLDVLSAVEGKRAGRLFQQRTRREQNEERG